MIIKKNKISFCIILSIVFIVFIYRFLIELGLPDACKYILDVLNIFLFAVAVSYNHTRQQKNMFSVFSIFIVMLTLWGTIGLVETAEIWNFKILNYIFDLRGIARPVIFLYSCSVTLTQSQSDKIKHCLVIFNLINFVYIVYQYFTLEVATFWMRGDNLNGFFGIETGGNTFVNALAVATTVIAIDFWQKKKYSLKIMILVIAVNLTIAMLIELKYYFIEIILIAAVYSASYLRKLTLKKLILLFIVLLVLAVCMYYMIQLLYKLYPIMKGTLSLRGLIENTASEGYSNRNDLNRLTFIQGVNNKIFKGNIFNMLFGVGLGIPNLNGDFAPHFESTHYTWFSSAYIYVSTGIIGLIIYILMLLSPIVLSKKNSRRLVVCCCLLLIMFLIYNETLRTEASYIIILLIATAFSADDRGLLDKIAARGNK